MIILTYTLSLVTYPPLCYQPLRPQSTRYKFPHGSIPAEWVSIVERTSPAATVGSDSEYPARVRARDASCRVSEFEDALATDIAHLVPKAPAEETWVSAITSSVDVDMLISIMTVCVQPHAGVQSVEQPRNKLRHPR